MFEDAKTSANDDNDTLASVFEERAEHLNRHELETWSEEMPHESEILAKLQGPGAKLLVGPRGSGKSTLLRKAYFSLTTTDSVLPAYVNFAKSLALEPLFHHRADALKLFRQWILYKIVTGLAAGFIDGDLAVPSSLADAAEIGKGYISDLEKGIERDGLSNLIAPSQLLIQIEQWTI